MVDKKLDNEGMLVRFGGVGTSDDSKFTKSSSQSIEENKKSMEVIEPDLAFEDLIRLYLLNSTARKCIDLIAKNVVNAGYKITGGVDGGEESVFEEIKSVFDEINPEITFEQLIRNFIIDLQTTGNAAIEVSRGLDGRVRRMYNVSIGSIRMLKGRKGEFRTGQRFVQNYNSVADKVYFNKYYPNAEDRTPDNGYEPELNGEGKKTNEIIWMKLPNPSSSFYGSSPSESLLNKYLTSKYVEEFNVNEFENGLLSKFVITVTGGSLSKDSAEALSVFLSDITSGKKRSTIPILNTKGNDAKIDIKQISEGVKEGSFLNLQKFNREEIYSAFGVPPILLSLVDNANRSNSIGQHKKFHELEIEPLQWELSKMFTKIVKYDLGYKDYSFEFNPVDRRDKAQESKIVTDRQKMGQISLNEARISMGDDPIDEDGANERFIYLGNTLLNVKDLDKIQSQEAMEAQGKSQGEVIVESLMNYRKKLEEEAENYEKRKGVDDEKFSDSEYPSLDSE